MSRGRKSTVEQLLKKIKEAQRERKEGRGRPRAIPKEVYPQIAELLARGMSKSDIAQKLGVSYMTIHRVTESSEFKEFYEKFKEEIEAAQKARKAMTNRVLLREDVLDKMVRGETWSFEACERLSDFDAIRNLCKEWVSLGRSRQNLENAVRRMADIYDYMCRIKQKCDPDDWASDDFIDFANQLLAEGKTSDTVRQYLTRFWDWRPDLKEDPTLKGRHAVWKRKGVRKGEAHVLTPEEVAKVLSSDDLSKLEKLYLMLWITTGAREYDKPSTRGAKELGWGGIVGLRWEDIKWCREGRENLPCEIDVRETKTTKAGAVESKEWKNIRLDLFFPQLPRMLKEWWEKNGKPKEGWIWKDPKEGVKLYRRIVSKLRKLTGKDNLVAHDIRRTHAYWLVLTDVPLELVAGGVRGDKIVSPLGVGWEDLTTMIDYYADLAGRASKYVDMVQKVYHTRFEGLT